MFLCVHVCPGTHCVACDVYAFAYGGQNSTFAFVPLVLYTYLFVYSLILGSELFLAWVSLVGKIG